MPQQTKRQAPTNELLELFVLQTLAEGQAKLLKLLDTDSETSESQDGDPPLPQLKRIHIPKNGIQLSLTLFRYKAEHLALFQSLLRVTPSTFDALLLKIQDHPVFQSNSDKQQIPVNQQLAVILYRFGHHGNAASMQKVGLWARLGYGTVDKCTQRVMKAVCDEGFRRVVMRWPDDIQREEASRWVESQSCAGWRGGFYGNTWYDHKSNYSLNIQLISTPNLRIVDYGVGLPGSQHDVTAWKGTRIPQEHEHLLGRDEWVWADTAYPLQTWFQAPYKKYGMPDKDLPENTRYNYYVSRVRVRSEHCVGFLKGQWSSLCGLRLHINKPSHIWVATIWEAEEGEGGDIELNEFFCKGLSLLEEEQRLCDGCNAHGELNDREHDHAGGHDVDMIWGWLRWEE
ncbi:hypothetical protein K439DRAFT_1616396 [Ramaria rubella]|nr:hypothetical protein K439DRAFT_1616396 [Ramaria rubella]